jgi:hypothetical protein
VGVRRLMLIAILLVVILSMVSAAWYLSLPREIPSSSTPAGSFPVVEVDNNRTINLTFEKLEGSGNARYEDCRLFITDPQSAQYKLNFTGITWTNNEAKNDSVIPGIDLRIIRSSGQTTFSTGNLVELESSSGMLMKGNWTITLIYRLTGGTIASRTIVV